jgi:hypothetical protein
MALLHECLFEGSTPLNFVDLTPSTRPLMASLVGFGKNSPAQLNIHATTPPNPIFRGFTTIFSSYDYD